MVKISRERVAALIGVRRVMPRHSTANLLDELDVGKTFRNDKLLKNPALIRKVWLLCGAGHAAVRHYSARPFARMQADERAYLRLKEY